MTPGARVQTAIEILNKIWSGYITPHEIIRNYFRSRRFAGSSDRRAIKVLIYEIIRKHARLTWWIEQSNIDNLVSPRSLVIVYLSSINNLPQYKISKIFSGLHYQPKSLSKDEKLLSDQLLNVNLNHPKMPRYVINEYPEWLDASFFSLWGHKIDVETQSLNKSATLDLRVNTLKSNIDQAIESLKTENIEASRTPLSPIGLRVENNLSIQTTKAFKTGLIEVQDEGSQLIALSCGAKENMKVIDFCAGAGGKSLALGGIMANCGEIIACDTSHRRLAALKPRLKRSGITNLTLKVLSAKSDPWINNKQNQADRVLCDVPCSGTGTWRRNPYKRWCFTKENLHDICKKQKNILRQASLLVKKGGCLIYATCSLLPQENQEQVNWFEKTFTNFKLVPIFSIVQKSSIKFNQLDKRFLQLSPASTNTDGFFCVAFEKIS